MALGPFGARAASRRATTETTTAAEATMPATTRNCGVQREAELVEREAPLASVSSGFPMFVKPAV